MSGNRRPNEPVLVTLDDRLADAAVIYKSGELGRAFELFEGIANDYPDDAESVFNMGVILDRNGDKEGCIERMRTSLARDSHFHKAKLNLAATLAEQDQLAEAARIIHQALSTKPGVPQWIGERMLACIQQVQQTALSRVRAEARSLQGGLVTGAALSRVREGLGAFFCAALTSCDLILDDGGLPIFLVAMPEGESHVYRKVAVDAEKGGLTVMDEAGRELNRIDLPA